MTATPSPRKDRGTNVSRRKFGWGWLALCIACLVLLVVLVVHDRSARSVNAAARVSKERMRTRTPDSAMLPKAGADAEAGPLIAGPLIEMKTAPAPTDSATVSPLPTALVFQNQKTRIVSANPAAGGASLISIRDIQPEFVKSPVYVLAKGQAKAFTPRTWLRVVVTFDLSGVPIDELTFRYRITIGTKTFSGSTTHAGVFGASQHQAAAFVIPSAVEPLVQRWNFDANKSVAIEVTALNGKTEIARASLGELTIVQQRERPGFVRSVGDTPFAPLEIDLYDLTAP